MRQRFVYCEAPSSRTDSSTCALGCPKTCEARSQTQRDRMTAATMRADRIVHHRGNGQSSSFFEGSVDFVHAPPAPSSVVAAAQVPCDCVVETGENYLRTSFERTRLRPDLRLAHAACCT